MKTKIKLIKFSFQKSYVSCPLFRWGKEKVYVDRYYNEPEVVHNGRLVKVYWPAFIVITILKYQLIFELFRKNTQYINYYL